ncbi:MAG: DUF58 domain-containing protein [Azoarcus sp.]|jgi:uncharacterized protein (DUF58 family)|nr:DUF58 domain-containing protein [Azoarcus sp.]
MSPVSAFARLPSLFRRSRPEKVEATPITLSQSRIYVLPTFSGLAFVGMLGAMLLTSINYGLSLGYAFSFLLGGIGIVSSIHAFRNLLRLSIRPGRVEDAFCGGSAVFHLLIDNPDSYRRPAMRLLGGKTPELRGETRFDLPPCACSDIALALPARQRGRMLIGRTVIETRWPLGLVRACSILTPAMEALIFPAPEPAPPPLPPGPGGVSTKNRGAARIGNEDFAGLRAYQDTDSLHHLAWKVFARSGAMMTKQFSDIGDADLLFDWQALPAALSEEARLSRLTAWLLRAGQSEQRYALRLPAREFPIDRGDAHLYRCLAALAMYGSETEKSAAEKT